MKEKLKYLKSTKRREVFLRKTFPVRNTQNFSSWDKGTPGTQTSEGHQERPMT